MKVLLVVVVCIALAQAKRDLSRFKPRDVHPNFIPRVPKPNGSRIVGGNEAQPNSFPHQVGLFLQHSSGDGYFCGGSILDSGRILTAAHCADGIVNVQVVAGAHMIREDEPTQQVVESSVLRVHPGWNADDLSNDIAIIILPQELDLSAAEVSAIAQLSASETGNSFEGAAATISGWGKDSDSSETISPVLRYIDVPVISNDICNIYFLGMIKPTHICTDQGICSGDSGGPLYTNVNGEKKQIGVVSFGISLGCESGWPGVYTRASEYADFIQNTK